MAEEVALSAIVSTRNVKQELDVGYTSDTILKIILEEIYDYVKISPSEREDTEVFLDETKITSEYFTKSIEELGIEEGNTIKIKEKTLEDGSRTKQGKIWVLNATKQNWTLLFTPNTDHKLEEAGKTWRFNGPNIPVPIVGKVAVGGVTRATANVNVQVGDLDKDSVSTTKTFSPHMESTIDYQNWMEGRDPLPVAVSLYDQAGQLREKTIVKDRHAIIITNTGAIPAKIRRKGLIGRKMPTWKPEIAPSNLPDLDYDPHANLKKGERCQVCQNNY